VARWSVPTVVTITLGARPLAAVSCPPCTKMSGGKCRACTISEILNCNCEPCLGPPYCTGGSASVSGAPGRVSGGGVRVPTGATSPGRAPAQGGADAWLEPLLRRQERRPNPFTEPLYRDPFGLEKAPSGGPGLYERLRGGATTPDRRRF
jgi:hypothetical protein